MTNNHVSVLIGINEPTPTSEASFYPSATSSVVEVASFDVAPGTTIYGPVAHMRALAVHILAEIAKHESETEATSAN